MRRYAAKIGRMLGTAGVVGLLLTGTPLGEQSVSLPSDLELVRATKTTSTKPTSTTTATKGRKTTTTTPVETFTLSAWQSEGVHPQAAAQATARGRRIVDLQAFDGKIYAGYGDYEANTGPIAVSALTPGAGYSQEYTADTEATYNFRDIGGVLYAPSIDPRVAADFTAGAPWAGTNAVEAAHVFDMATTDGTDLWMVGSQDMDAVAWRSLDGGATWAESLRVAPATAGEFARFYFAGVLGGKLYVQAFDSYQGAQTSAKVFDGPRASAPAIVNTWYNGWRPVEFNGKLVLHGYGQGLRGPVFAYDGVTSSVVSLGYDFEVTNGQVYVLDDAELRTSSDLASFSALAVPSPEARSLAVAGERVFIGTASSEILSATLNP